MAVCSHCHTVMHPSGSEKDYFANGAAQVKMKGKDDIPDWVLSATGNLCERDRLSPRRISEDTVGHVREHCNTRREEYEAFQVGKLLQRRQPSLRTAACSSGCCCRPLPTALQCFTTETSTFVSTACVTRMTDAHAGPDGSCGFDSRVAL